MRDVGIGLIIAGVVVFGIAIFLPVSAPTGVEFGGLGEVVNIGRLQTQMIAALAGLTLFLAGIVLLAADRSVAAFGAPPAVGPATQMPAVAEHPVWAGPYNDEEMKRQVEIATYRITKEDHGWYIYRGSAYRTLDQAIRAAQIAEA